MHLILLLEIYEVLNNQPEEPAVHLIVRHQGSGLDKQYALAQLAHTAQIHVLGLASATLLLEPAMRPILQVGKANFGTFEVKFDQVVTLLDHPVAGPEAIRELLKMHLRSLIGDGYRLVETYAAESKQAHLLRQAPWYNFARIVRNALAHDVRFQFTPNDLNLLPVSWRTKVIEATMEGQDLTFEFFGPADGWQLFCDMQEFVESSVT